MASRRNAYRRLRKALLVLPEGIPADHSVRPPNKPLKLYSGAFELHQGIAMKVRGTVEQHWYPYPQVRFRGRSTGRRLPEIGPATLRIRKCFTTAPAYITETSFGTRPRVSGYVPGMVRLGQNRAVQALKFHVPNFHDYVGRPVRFTRGDRIWHSASRLTLVADGWNAVIDQEPEFKRLGDVLKARGGFGVGHAGLLTRSDGKRFKVSEASDIWSTLHFFLSFVRGLWCGPIIATGVGRKSSLWTEWGSWRISDWKGVSTWFPKQDPSRLNEAFVRFRRLWNRPMWNEPLRELVHWYIEANLNAGALEGSLVLGHTALELLAWMHVVVDKRLSSIRGFKTLKGGSSARVETALTSLGIPISIPTDMQGLASLAASGHLSTGPKLVSKVRNVIVHPTPSNRRFLDRAPIGTRFEVLQLCLWYLELGMLSLLGYRGKYVNRLKTGVFVGEATTDVPWA